MRDWIRDSELNDNLSIPQTADRMPFCPANRVKLSTCDLVDNFRFRRERAVAQMVQVDKLCFRGCSASRGFRAQHNERHDHQEPEPEQARALDRCFRSESRLDAEPRSHRTTFLKRYIPRLKFSSVVQSQKCSPFSP